MTMTHMLSRSRCSGVSESIRLKIVLQRYRTGDKLVEIALAEEYGVSRGSVRASLQALESEGLITTLSNGTKRVVGFDRKYAVNMYDVRKKLEIMAVEEAIGKNELRYDILVDTLKMLGSGEVGENVTRDEICDLDMSFHRGLVSLSGNKPLINCWETIAPITGTILRLNIEAQYVTQYYAEFRKKHQWIIDRILTRERSVIACMDEHIEAAKTVTLGMLDSMQK